MRHRHCLSPLLTLALLSLCGPAWAQVQISFNPRLFTISQPGRAPVVIPAVETLSTADQFYSYTSASSHTGFEQIGRSLLFLHRDVRDGQGALSLIITHGIDDVGVGVLQPNAKVDADLWGLPPQVTVTRSDDGGELRKINDTTAQGRWTFGKNTDGGVLQGFPDDQAWSITMTTTFYYGISEWQYYFASGDNLPLDPDLPLTITYEPSVASLNGAVETLEGSEVTLCAVAYTQSRGILAPPLNYSFQWSATEASTGQTSDKSLFCGQHTWLQDGTAEVTLALVQGGEQASLVVPVTIRNVAPTVAALPAQGTEGQPLTLRAQATDPGADTLFYRWDVDGDGLWDTDYAASDSYAVQTPHWATTRYHVGVFDGDVEVVAEGSVAVQNVAPSLDPIADAEIRSGRTWTYSAAAQDPGGAGRLTWRLLQAPAGATVSGAGVVSWRPSTAQRGLHELQLQVSDGALTAQRTFRLLVNDCGSGSLELGELCDDGNRNPEDGCDDQCRLEPGYLCLIPGQVCEKLPAKDHKGKEFIFGFITNYQDNYGTKEVHLTGEYVTEVLIEYPVVNPTFTQRVTIDPASVQIVALPASADATGAVRLSAQKEFITYMINRGPYTSDAGVALPVDVLGKEYVVAAVPGYWGGKTEAQGVIVGVYDNTTVRVGAQTITLQRGQDYRVLGNSQIGTWISADRPVAVTSGTGCANIPTSNVYACDTVFQMVPPSQAWGTTVPVGPLPDRPSGSLYQIYAAEDGTAVYQDNASIATLNRGQYRAIGPLAGPHLFTANKPIYVVQYMTGQGSSGATTGDPMMLNVSPAEQFINEYTFSTVGGGQFAQHFLQIYAPASAVGQLTLDGAVVNPASFQAIPGTDLRVALVSILEGVHTTRSPKPHGIATIGLNGYDSYGYTGGALFAILSVADGNPPQCALTQSSPSRVTGTASDDRPSEDTNQNGQLDNGEDLNQNNALDRDTGLTNVSLLGEVDVTWETTFVPGDTQTSFQITSNEPRRLIQGSVLLLDGVGNATACAFTLAPDSDGDGIFDHEDADSDNDGIPDRDELPQGVNADADHDGDGWPNWRDPQAPGFVDQNGDGVDDRLDADRDGVPNHIDLDADGDGVPDLAERLDPALDANGDGRLDDPSDADSDGLADLADASPADPGDAAARWPEVDTDGDGAPDRLDADSDNDGLLDLAEVGLSDANGDGRADGPDSDGDGLVDALDPDQGGAPAIRRDTDGDGTPDLRDGDDDGDGVHSAIERWLGTDPIDPDSDHDGIDDFIETDDGLRVDTDGDGLIDALDADSDNDTLSDALEGTADPDGDGVGAWRDFDCMPAWEGQPCALQGLQGACAQGLTRCEGFGVTCAQATWPAAELCDDVDNDCDGATDEALQRACATDCGGGAETCASGQWQGCTAQQPIDELCDGQDNDCNGLIDDSPFCRCLYFPQGAPIEPQVEWTWSSSAFAPDHTQLIAAPSVANLTDDNGDGVIDQGDTPEVILSSTRPDTGATYGAWLRALDGATGLERWAATSRRVQPWSTPAVADLDGDGLPEIVTHGWHHDTDRVGLVAFNHLGQERWVNRDVQTYGTYTFSSPAIADISPASPGAEIATCFWLVSATGQTLWSHPEHKRGTPLRCAPAVADLDGDGLPEVITDVRAYRHDGSVLWYNDTLATRMTYTDVAPAVADLNGDGDPEIVHVSSRVYVLDGLTGAILADAALPGGGRGGAPNVADFDGDGLPEIGTAGASQYSTFKYTEPGGLGQLDILWSRATRDVSSNVTGSSVFDFNGDGLVEVAYNDEQYLRLYNGADGATLYEARNWTGTAIEYPVIVDVDHDGNAELLVARNTRGNNHNTYSSPAEPPLGGLVVLGDANDNWVATRTIWNQYAYHVTNIEENASVPASPPQHWRSPDTNSFRNNNLPGSEAFLAPDLTITAALLTQGAAMGDRPGADVPWCPAANRATLTVCNEGDQRVAPGASVSVYRRDGAQLVSLASTATTRALLPGGLDACEQLTLEWIGDLDGAAVLVATVDGDLQHNECDEDNNTWTLGSATLQTPQPERCDDVDNDCDGAIDQDLFRDCNRDCLRGQQRCEAGQWDACDTPAPAGDELCDGYDNDCDGIVDNTAAACGDGAYACVCRGGGAGCQCVYALVTDGPDDAPGCAPGCPVGTACGPDLTCVPWCDRDQSCPQGQLCGPDDTCVPAQALYNEAPTHTPTGGCAMTPTRAPSTSLWLALASLAALALRARR